MQFDYIIIGAGSAGCVLANRLSADPRNSVLLLEYGGSDRGPFIQMPAALSYPMNMPLYDWGYKAAQEASLDNRALVCPRGKVIGGSSSINGMIFVRGHAQDFERWQELGAQGWSFQDVLPYFKKMEHAHGSDDPLRGKDGPLHVTRGSRSNPLHAAFTKACEQAGYPITQDYNGAQQEGFGAADMTVWKGQRWSTANAYLKPALKRANLTLIKRAKAERLVLEGTKARAVVFAHKGQIQQASANKEIIVACGAINSPLLLQASGIGNPQLLREQGIQVQHALAGVGENLQDHLEVYFQVKCLEPVSLYKYLNPVAKAAIGAQWLLTRKGLGASNQFETLGFIRSEAQVPYPDIQYHFLPVAVRYDGKAPAEGHGFQLHVGPMRSKSRGSVRLGAGGAQAKPDIRFNYLSHPDDMPEWRRCLRISRHILAQAGLDRYRGAEIQPGAQAQSDAQLDAFVRAHAESAYHPCGTCKMGSPDDLQAVVDPHCKVIGLKGIRVVDSSIFPQITNGNLNAPTIMSAEKASDHILGRA